MKNQNIAALPEWQATAESHQGAACIVKNWELVNLKLDDKESLFLLGTIVNDYKGRWSAGDYVFTTEIEEVDLETGFVKTGNSLYCLAGDGLEVFPTLEEAYKMRITGQPLSSIRDVEEAGFKIIGTIDTN